MASCCWVSAEGRKILVVALRRIEARQRHRPGRPLPFRPVTLGGGFVRLQPKGVQTSSPALPCSTLRTEMGSLSGREGRGGPDSRSLIGDRPERRRAPAPASRASGDGAQGRGSARRSVPAQPRVPARDVSPPRGRARRRRSRGPERAYPQACERGPQATTHASGVIAAGGCGGEGGIRTRDGLPQTAFPVRRHSPLGDLSPRGEVNGIVPARAEARGPHVRTSARREGVEAKAAPRTGASMPAGM